MKFIFSLFPLYGLAAIFGIFYIGSDSFAFSNDGYSFFSVIGLFLIAAITLVTSFVALFTHISDLGSLHEYTQDVADAKEHIDSIRETIKTVTDIAKDLDAAVLAKSDVDHPAVRAMQELRNAQEELVKRKRSLTHVQGNIHARKIGPFGYIVTAYGNV